jgi:uncharacterized membrane protein YbhN (UPF0104 family)
MREGRDVGEEVGVKVTAAQFSPLRIFRMFSSSANAPRQRRPTDVLMLLVSLVLVVVPALNAPGPMTIDSAVAALLTELDAALGWFWQLCYAALLAWVVVLALAPVVRFHRGRLRLLVDYALAASLAFVLAGLLAGLGGIDLAAVVDGLATTEPPPDFPAVRLAVCGAVIVAASPHVTRPFRLVGRGVLLVGALATVALGIAYASGVLAGFALALAAGAVVHLVLGAPGGELTAEQVAAALLDLSVQVDSVEFAAVQAPGEQLLVGLRSDGPDVLVKVFGRDAWDAQLIGSTWTALTRRGEAPRLTMGRRERVSHEAMVALLAERAGAPVLPVLTSGEDIGADALLVVEAPARRLADLAPAAVDDGWLAEAWVALLRLHEAGIAHRRIDQDRVVERRDGVVALTDFADARLNPADADRMIDRVHLLVTTWLVVGAERSVAAAVQALGADGLAETMPYLQEPVLSRPLRHDVNTAEADLDHLRAVAVAASGAHDIPLVELRRVTGGSLVKSALVVFVVYSLISLLAGVDLAEVVQQLRTADYWLVLLALLVALLVQPGLAFATLGATLQRLPFLPVLVLQYAIQFIAVVLPATAARVAVEIRFFERLGVTSGAAVTMGMLDGFSGFVVQVGLLLLIWFSALPGVTTSVASASSSSGSSSDGSPSLLALIAVIVVIWAVVTFAVPSRRRRALRVIPNAWESLRHQAGTARSALRVLRHPGKLARMLGGNLWAQLVQAVVLGICLAAFGESASLSQLILVNTFVSLFAGLMPVPGGVGVAEAGLTYGLQAIGVPSAVALSTAIAFRLVTFYLPPLWGSMAMRWLRKRAYL